MARTSGSTRVKRAPRTPGKVALGVLKWLGIGILILALIGGGLFGIAYASTPIPDPNKDFQTENTRIYFADGKSEMGSFSIQNRISIPYKQMPQTMKDAMVAAENQSFWTDPGISLPGMARAVYTALAPGEDTVGGSTLTQQYVKLLYLNPEKTLTRKLNEIIIALKVSQEVPKEDILEGYLNTVYFGRGAYGIQAASQAYFGKDARKLSLSESAALAALANAPGLLDPHEGKKEAADLLERYQYTLNGMVDMKTITPEQRAKVYTKLPKFPELERDSRFGGPNGFLLKMVQDELKRLDFTGDEIQGGGLKVVTTVDAKMQDAAVESAQRAGVNAAGKGGLGVKGLHPTIASVDNSNGGVLALYGGPDYVKSNKNWATTARPTGSTFKPWALVAALRHGFRLEDRFNGNNNLMLPGATRPIKNAGGGSYGNITMLNATTHSVNTAYVDIVSQIPDGPGKVLDAAKDAGLPETRGWVKAPSVPLGYAEVSPLDAALGYSTLANEGKRNTAHIVAEVKDKNGKTVYKFKNDAKQAIDKAVAINATYALTRVTSSGTGSRVSALGRPVAGKTGTRYNSEKSATEASWFVGATKQVSTAVMFCAGEDGNGNLDRYSSGFYGSGYPASTWLDYMSDAMRGMPVEAFSGPVAMDNRVMPRYVPPPTTARPTARPTTTTTTTASATPAPTTTSAKPTAAPTTKATPKPTQAPTTKATPAKPAATPTKP